jgi:hypothetical protein
MGPAGVTASKSRRCFDGVSDDCRGGLGERPTRLVGHSGGTLAGRADPSSPNPGNHRSRARGGARRGRSASRQPLRAAPRPRAPGGGRRALRAGAPPSLARVPPTRRTGGDGLRSRDRRRGSRRARSPGEVRRLSPRRSGERRCPLRASSRRRLPAADYLIAASAAGRGFGVLHEDRHFDLLATVLGFESVRLSAAT